MSLTKPDPKVTPAESLTSSQSNVNVVRPNATVTDDDGWTVQSASAENLTADELKARAEAAGPVKRPEGQKDVRDDGTPASKETKPAPTPAADDDDADLPDEDVVEDADADVDDDAARTETQEDDEDGEDAEPVTEVDDEDKPDPPKRRPSRLERRKARIQGEIDAKVAEARRLDRELEDRRRRLGESPTGEERRTKADAPPPIADDPRDPKPTWKAYQAEGKEWDEYQDDRDAWAIRQFKRETATTVVDTQRATEETRLARQRATNFVEKLEAAKEKYSDFDAAIENLETVPNTPFVSQLAAQIPDGAELMYYLGRRINLAEQLSALTAPLERNGQLHLNPRHAPILDAVRDSTNPHALLRALVKDGGKEFRKVEGLPVAQAFKALYALESALPAPTASANGSDAGKAKKKTTAPPLRPPAGSTVANPSKGKTAGSATGTDDFAAEVAAMNADDRKRGRRF